MNEQIARYAELIDMLKAKGVRHFSAEGVSVELGAPAVTPLKSDAKLDDDRCACGHLLSDHVGGLCARDNCDPAKCAEKP